MDRNARKCPAARPGWGAGVRGAVWYRLKRFTVAKHLGLTQAWGLMYASDLSVFASENISGAQCVGIPIHNANQYSLLSSQITYCYSTHSLLPHTTVLMCDDLDTHTAILEVR